MRTLTLLAALALAAPLPLRAQQVYDGCPMEGDAALAGVQALNRLKNRYTAPPAAETDSGVTLAALLSGQISTRLIPFKCSSNGSQMRSRGAFPKSRRGISPGGYGRSWGPSRHRGSNR